MANFDVIVVGGGHAGCEAAAASARMGAKTALVTHRFDTIGVMSCNPAIGGLGKGHLVREVDALDGLMGRIIDQAGIQFRMLNRSKGPAVRGPRAQADRNLYRKAMQAEIAATPNLEVVECAAEGLLLDDNNQVVGIKKADGGEIRAKAVVLTTGTFLNGLIHLGEKQEEAGRRGEEPIRGTNEPPVKGLTPDLAKLGLRLGRLKTGTPARLDAKTIDWDKCTPQPGDSPPEPFSFLNTEITVPQIACYITHTNTTVHDAIRNNLHRAPMYSGQIDSIGPRYCPSIEDKVVRFADKDSHQIFLEPESLDGDTVYPNGISTSLPPDVQDVMIRNIVGLENVRIIQYGYAIEYDYVDPRELDNTLAVVKAPGLYLAGQINGTTGYEEAAAQGLLAGANAALRAEGQGRTFTLDRADAYLGVMVDDLIHRGTKEPYRMFTSRAEYRLLLRADNADQRLTPLGIAAGLVGEKRRTAWQDKSAQLEQGRALVRSLTASPNELVKQGFKVNQDGKVRSAHDLLSYPNISYDDLAKMWPDLNSVPQDIVEQLVIDAQYEVYLQRQESDINAFRRDEGLHIPADLDFAEISSLSTEIRLKLAEARPSTLGAAARIPGVTPAAVTALLTHIKKRERRQIA